MRKAGHRDGKLFGGFGIFPFSLVMLPVALAIFVVLSTPTHHGGNPELPHTRSAALLRGASSEDAIRVALLRDGSIYLNSRKVTDADLVLGLRLLIEQGSPHRVYLSVDQRSSYGRLKELLGLIRSLGIEDVSFLTEQRS